MGLINDFIRPGAEHETITHHWAAMNEDEKKAYMTWRLGMVTVRCGALILAIIMLTAPYCNETQTRENITKAQIEQPAPYEAYTLAWAQASKTCLVHCLDRVPESQRQTCVPDCTQLVKGFPPYLSSSQLSGQPGTLPERNQDVSSQDVSNASNTPSTETQTESTRAATPISLGWVGDLLQRGSTPEASPEASPEAVRYELRYDPLFPYRTVRDTFSENAHETTADEPAEPHGPHAPSEIP